MLTFLLYAHSESQHFHHSKHNDFIYISFIWFRIYIPTFHDMITYMQNRVWIINHVPTPTIPCFTYICYMPRSIIAYTKENQYRQLESFNQTSSTSRTIYPFLLNFHFLSFFLRCITRKWESSINNQNPSSNQPINDSFHISLSSNDREHCKESKPRIHDFLYHSNTSVIQRDIKCQILHDSNEIDLSSYLCKSKPLINTRHLPFQVHIPQQITSSKFLNEPCTNNQSNPSKAGTMSDPSSIKWGRVPDLPSSVHILHRDTPFQTSYCALLYLHSTSKASLRILLKVRDNINALFVRFLPSRKPMKNHQITYFVENYQSRGFTKQSNESKGFVSDLFRTSPL